MIAARFQQRQLVWIFLHSANGSCVSCPATCTYTSWKKHFCGCGGQEVAARVREEEGMREQFQAQKQQEELLRSMSTMMLQAFQQQQQQPQPGSLYCC